MTLPIKPAHTIIADRFASGPIRALTGFGVWPNRLRLELKSGEEIDARFPYFDSEQAILLVTLPDESTREVRPTELKAMWERRPNWRARCALGVAVIGLGISVGGMLGGAAAGLFLGGLGGAFASPLVIWLLQDVAPFFRWQNWLAEARGLDGA